MRELPLAISYLKGRPARTIMTILSIVIGVMIMFGLNGMAPALEDLFISNTQQVALSNVDLYVTRKDGSFFQQNEQEQVTAIPGMASTATMIARAVTVPSGRYKTPNETDITTIQVYGVDTSTTDDAFNVIMAGGRRLLEGRTLQPGETGDVVLISKKFSDLVGVGLGQSIDLPGASGWLPFQVVGILDDPGILLGTQQVFMPLTAAQGFLNTPGRINIIMGRYAEDADAQAIEAAARAHFGSGYELAPLSGGASVWAALLEFTSVIFSTFGLLALAMAGLIMFNTFRTSVVERRRDIGMLRAVGAKRRIVMRTVLYEGLIQAGLGTLLGILLGFGFGYLATSALSNMFSNLLGGELGSPRFGPLTFAASIFFGMGIPMISVWLPARDASHVTPLEAMRPQTIEQEKSVRRSRMIIGIILLVLGVAGLFSGEFSLMAPGMLLFLIALGQLGPLLISPVTSFFSRALNLAFGQEGGLAAGNIARQPRRASITASSLMVSLAILIGLGGMLSSVYGGALVYLNNSLRSDYIMMNSLVVTNDTVGAGPELANTVRRIPGVADVTTMRQTDVLDANGVGIRLIGLDPLKYAQIAGLTFLEGDRSTFDQMVGGKNVIVNGRFASQFGTKVGDTLTLSGDHGPVPVKVVAVGLDYLNIKLPTVYIEQEALTREYGIRNDVFVLIDAKPDADRQQLEEDLQAATKAYPGFGVISHNQLQESQQQVARAGTIAMNVVLALLATPSLLGLANAMGINVLERTREIGMLRAVGARRRQVHRMIVAESLLLSLMGIALGIVSGIMLSMVMTGVLDFAGLHIPYSFPAVGVLTAIAAGLLCGIVAALIPARRASDLQIVSALAYE